MIRIIFVIVIAYLVSWLLMSGKAEEDILQAEIAEKNRILEESIGEPRMYQPPIPGSAAIVAENFDGM
jgi:hypothetical protein